jgi:hypothetical protein
MKITPHTPGTQIRIFSHHNHAGKYEDTCLTDFLGCSVSDEKYCDGKTRAVMLRLKTEFLYHSVLLI